MALEYQRYGRNKESIVNKGYIESGQYRNKFDSVADNKEVSRVLYAKAKEMLLHRSGTMLEDMYWIDGKTGEVIACALNEQTECEITYTEAILKAIAGRSNIIAMHNHPHSMPPSAEDFNSAFSHGYSLGLVLCHDSTVYAYCSNQRIPEKLHALYSDDFCALGFTERDAQVKSLDKIKKNYNFDFWEV